MTEQKKIPSGGDPVIRTVGCVAGISFERDVPIDELHASLADHDTVLWMDVSDPGPDELTMLLVEFGFHPLALEDLASGEQRSKIEEYRDYTFAVVYAVVVDSAAGSIRMVEVDLFIGRNYLVSVHRGPVPALDEALRRWTRGGALLREGIGYLVYSVMDAVIDAYFPIIATIELKADHPDFDQSAGTRQRGVEELLELKRTLYRIRRALYPLRETFGVFLRANHRSFTSGSQVYLQVVFDHILRILDTLEMELDMVNGVLEAHLTVISSRLNSTMKTLTVMTIVVASIGLVFGAFGMNFAVIPLQNEPWGFWAVTAGTVIATAAMMYLVRRRL